MRHSYSLLVSSKYDVNEHLVSYASLQECKHEAIANLYNKVFWRGDILEIVNNQTGKVRWKREIKK